MAGIRIAVPTGGKVALVGGVAKTVLQIVAPANQRVLMKGFSFSFDGILSTQDEVLVELVKQSSAGTSSPATVVRDGDPGTETLQTTANKNCTVEPTTTDVLRNYLIHPQGGGLEIPYGIDDHVPVPGGTRLGLRMTSVQNVNCVGHIRGEE